MLETMKTFFKNWQRNVISLYDKASKLEGLKYPVNITFLEFLKWFGVVSTISGTITLQTEILFRVQGCTI